MAEMTGRRGRMVRSGRRDKVHYELRDSGGNSLESLNNREVGSQATPHGFLLKFLFVYIPTLMIACVPTVLNHDRSLHTVSFPGPAHPHGKSLGMGLHTYKVYIYILYIYFFYYITF